MNDRKENYEIGTEIFVQYILVDGRMNPSSGYCLYSRNGFQATGRPESMADHRLQEDHVTSVLSPREECRNFRQPFLKYEMPSNRY